MYNRGNRKIGHPSGNLISFEGKGYKSYSEMARDYGKTGKELHKRLIRGWTLKEALKIPVNIERKREYKLLLVLVVLQLLYRLTVPSRVCCVQNCCMLSN